MNRKNLLIISDTHIDDYKDYNYVNRHRFNNYEVYGDLIIEMAIEQKCDTLLILGDIINVPTNRAYILYLVKKIFRKWSKHFSEIYYILGQHDCDTKSSDHNLEDSVIHSIALDNMFYMDHKIAKIGETTIAFMNYYKEQDLSWIENKVDLFCGHVTINSLYGQDIDNSKFEEGICGDIHGVIDQGNLHSVGCQVQRYFGDSEYTTCIVYDAINKTWKRVPIDPDHELFMRLRGTSMELESGFSKEKNSLGMPKYYYRYEPLVLEKKEVQNYLINEDERLTTIKDVVESYVTQYGMLNIHKEVLARYVDKSAISMDFELIELKLINHRSVEELTVNFKDLPGSILLIGPNGSGKSTVIYGIYYCLKPGNDYTYHTTEGKDYSMLQLRLKYFGQEFTIFKDTQEIGLAIDGEWQSYNNKAQCNADILERLPFINYLDSFFFLDDTVNIFSSYSSERRIELLSNYYKLYVVDEMRLISEDLKSLEGEKWEELNSQIKLLDATLVERERIYKSKKEEFEEKYNQITEDDLIKLLEKEKKKYEENKKLEFKWANFDEISILSKKEKSESDLKIKQEELNKYIQEIKTLELKYNTSDLNSLVKEYSDSEIKELEAELKTHESSFSSWRNRLDSIEDYLKDTTIINCPSCNSEIELKSYTIVNRDDYLAEKSDIIRKGNDLLPKYTKIKERLEEIKGIKAFQMELSTDISTYNSNKGHIKTLNEFIRNISEALSELNTTIDEMKTLEKPISSESILNNISNCTEAIKTLKELKNEEKELSTFESDNNLQTLRARLEDINARWYEFDNYSNLFSTSGKIYKHILEFIISRFNSERIKYEVTEGTYRGSKYCDITCAYKPDGADNYREYWRLSKGQQALCDIDFVSNLITKCGLVVFDEMLKFLSPENQIHASMIIDGISSKHKIVTVQSDNYPFIDNKLFFTYDGKVTTVTGMT